METKKVLNRNNQHTDELSSLVTKTYKGIEVAFKEVYYLDNEVDEEAGAISDVKVKHYTKNQMERNIKALKNAYYVAKGAADPKEIYTYRKKLKIPASTLSFILGFSKNTISNIENEGVTSLPSGRLIKTCIENSKLMIEYIKMCDVLDDKKKVQLENSILEQGH